MFYAQLPERLLRLSDGLLLRKGKLPGKIPPLEIALLKGVDADRRGIVIPDDEKVIAVDRAVEASVGLPLHGKKGLKKVPAFQPLPGKKRAVCGRIVRRALVELIHIREDALVTLVGLFGQHLFKLHNPLGDLFFCQIARRIQRGSLGQEILNEPLIIRPGESGLFHFYDGIGVNPGNAHVRIHIQTQSVQIPAVCQMIAHLQTNKWRFRIAVQIVFALIHNRLFSRRRLAGEQTDERGRGG